MSLPVRIASLPAGLHADRLTPSAEAVGVDPETFSDIVVDVRLDVGAGHIVATFDASATAHLVCDRTAEPFEQAVEGVYTVLFTTDPDEVGDDAEGDVVLYGPHDASVDLAPAVRDTLVLALPARRLAPGADALDVPLSFGAPGPDAPDDDAPDPRWDALRRLRPDDADEASD